MQQKLYTTLSGFLNRINEDIDRQLYLDAYINRVNRERDDLLVKVKKNPNFVSVLGVEIEIENFGKPNKCERNTWNFVKQKMENGETEYYPVGGFLFEGQSLFPIEHWWIFNKKTNKNIEITQLIGAKPWFYAGVINFEINDEILNSEIVWDIDFFKGGNPYSWYFK